MMQTVLTLIKKEYWENKSMFFVFPAVLAIIGLVIAGGFTLTALTMGHTAFGVSASTFPADVPKVINALFTFVSAPFAVVLWLVLFNFFLSTLYTERKDGSILFWRSLPISQVDTMIAKVVAGLILAPLCTMAIVIMTQFFMMIMASLVIWHLTSFSPGDLWQLNVIFANLGSYLVAMVKQGLWLFPLLGWCMFCSIAFNKSPFLRALIIPAVISIVEAFLFHASVVWTFCVSRFTSGFQSMSVYLQNASLHPFGHSAHHWGDVANNMSFYFSAESMVLGLVIGLAFIAAAAYLRRRCYGYDR